MRNPTDAEQRVEAIDGVVTGRPDPCVRLRLHAVRTPRPPTDASNQRSSAVAKYRYAVATEMSARSAASGIDGALPSRTSSVAAWSRAARVRAFWLARPGFVRDRS